MIKIPSTKISKLDLSNQDLTEFPVEILALKNLKKLNLSGNKIQQIPKEIEKLKNLELLDLSNNSINNFYSKLCSLKKLKTLNLNNNRIKTVPRQIEQLENLKILQVANNKISELPSSFVNLKNLKQLNISKNEFVNFPIPLLSVKTLSKLWINNLPLKIFPIKEINQNLKDLDAVYCFGSQQNADLVDASYNRLTKYKGNCLNVLREFNSNNLSETKDRKGVLKIIKQKVTKNKIFISYSHKDIDWLSKVQTHLKSLEYNNQDFDLWDDTKIIAGDEWKIEIENALQSSGIAILIISADFLASDFIKNEELPKLLKNAEKHGTRILPLIVRPCRFTKIPSLSKFQSVNSPNLPLSILNDSQAESELVKLTNYISDILGVR